MKTIQLVPKKSVVEALPDHIKALLPERIQEVACGVCGVACMKSLDIDTGAIPTCIDCFYSIEGGPVVVVVPPEAIEAADRLDEAIKEHERRN